VYHFLLALLILDAFLLMTVVLLQAGKGGGLAAMGGGGGDTLLGGRQSVTLLTRTTWWTGGIFLALCMILSLMTAGTTRTDPLLRGELRGGGTAPAGVPGIAEPTAPTSGQLTPGASEADVQQVAPPVTTEP